MDDVRLEKGLRSWALRARVTARGRSVWWLALVVLVGACDHCNGGSYTVPPRAVVNPHPTFVHASPGTQLWLRAIVDYFGPSGNLAARPPGTVLQWSVASETTSGLVTFVSHGSGNANEGDSVVISTGTLNVPASQQATLQVKLVGAPSGTQLSDGQVELVVLGSNMNGDRVSAAHVAPAFPTAALADGRTGTNTSVNDFSRAFASSGELASLTDGPSPPDPELAVLSPAKRAKVDAQNWGAAGVHQSIDVTTVGSSVSAPVTLWIAVDAALANAALADAKADLAIAARTFAGGRTGIALVEQIPLDPGTGAPAEIQLGHKSASHLPSACANPLTVFGFDPNTLVSPSPHVHVVYVADIPGVIRGYTCPPVAGRKWALSLVDYGERDATVLLHELGHVMLGLDGYFAGHMDWNGDVRSDNAMWTYEDGTRADSRRRFTVGQAFRMNVHAAGWLVIAGLQPVASTQVRACECNPYQYLLCPRIAHDLSPPPAPPNPFDTAGC